MQEYDELVKLARMCAKNAHSAGTKEVAALLWNMAKEYQEKAAKLDGGKRVDIGEPPRWPAD